MLDSDHKITKKSSHKTLITPNKKRIAIFHESSDFLEWEPISSNSEKIYLLITRKQYQNAATRDSRCFQ